MNPRTRRSRRLRRQARRRNAWIDAQLARVERLLFGVSSRENPAEYAAREARSFQNAMMAVTFTRSQAASASYFAGYASHTALKMRSMQRELEESFDAPPPGAWSTFPADLAAAQKRLEDAAGRIDEMLARSGAPRLPGNRE